MSISLKTALSFANKMFVIAYIGMIIFQVAYLISIYRNRYTVIVEELPVYKLRKNNKESFLEEKVGTLKKGQVVFRRKYKERKAQQSTHIYIVSDWLQTRLMSGYVQKEGLKKK